MSNLMELEKKVDLVVKLLTVKDSSQRETVLHELKGLSVDSDVNSDQPLKYVVEDFLIDLGIPSHLSGYKYLTHSICMLVENPHYTWSITKHVYPEVAKKCNTEPSRVERSIRHAIEYAFCRVGKSTVRDLFKNIVNKSGRPTNTEFIYRVVQVVQREIGEEV